MDAFKRMWQRGFEGQHIEELIGGVFSDFAPYAGAEHQRLSLVRQFDSCAAAAVTVEETGDLIVNVGHAAAGSTVFSTTGVVQVGASVKVPLPPARPDAPVVVTGTDAVSASSVSPVSGAKRFVSTVRGAQLGFGLPAVSRLPALPAADLDERFGQLEVEASVPALWASRCALGARAGPVAARLSRTPTVIETSDAAVGSRDNSRTDNSGSLQDTLTEQDRTEATVTKHQEDVAVYTLDASVCMPLAELQRWNSPTPHTTSDTGDVTERPSSLALTMGLQHPFCFSPAVPIAGDTLVGLALQNDRAVSEAYQANADDSAGHVAAAARNRFPLPPENTFRLLVVQTLLSATAQRGGASGGSGSGTDASGLFTGGTSPSRSTNTNSRRQNSNGSSSNDKTSTMTGSSPRSPSLPWYSLPTLVGCSLSFRQQLVRLSVASIFHDSEVDVETAAVLDVTQLVPHTPTLLKFGWNNTGRLALGITSLFNNALSVTLGVHATPGEDLRFGLEIKA